MAYLRLLTLWLIAGCGCGQVLCQSYSTFIDDRNIYRTLMPNDRTSLDDCHLRYFRLGSDSRRQDGKPFVPDFIKEFAHIGTIGWTGPDGKIQWNCIGTLIRQNYLLASGECATNELNVEPDVVRFGEDGGHKVFLEQIAVTEIIRHADGFALLQLEQNVSVHYLRVQACLWMEDDEKHEFKDLTTVSFGSNNVGWVADPNEKRDLRKVKHRLLTNEQCSRYYPGYRESQQICTEQINSRDGCLKGTGQVLETKLYNNGRVTPFLVGVAVPAVPCDPSKPRLFVKLVRYRKWLLKTLQDRGETVHDGEFDPHTCAGQTFESRDPDTREAYKDGDEWRFREAENSYAHPVVSPDNRVMLGWPSHLSVERNCSGILIEPNMVVTIADCTAQKGMAPAYIRLKDQQHNISEIIVHPRYQQGTVHNNIAVLRLKTSVKFTNDLLPVCIWYHSHLPTTGAAVSGTGLADVNLRSMNILFKGYEHAKVPTTLWTQVYSHHQCNLTDNIRKKIPQGLQREHLCVGNEKLLVPGTCELLSGGPVLAYIQKTIFSYPNIYGLNLLGHDCGFGTPALAVRFADHREWLESIILPRKRKTDAVLFVNQELDENDPCRYHSTGIGICVPINKCPKVKAEFLMKLPVIFCSSSGSIVCCPQEQILEDANHENSTASELDGCEQRYQHFRGPTKHEESSGIFSHIAEIGWTNKASTQFMCVGALITTNAVVSSIGCITEFRWEPQVVRIGFLGVKQPNSDFEVIPIREILLHKGFNIVSKANDIALIKLTSSIQPSPKKYPLCLWQNMTHTPLTMNSVFHRTSSVGSSLSHPLYVGDCKTVEGRAVDTNQLCTGQSSLLTLKENVCFNTGNPLVWTPWDINNASATYLVGLFSYGKCSGDVTATFVYSRMSSYVDWIRNGL